ncbi:hypothetical protein LINGRAHAP2_LOCUS27301 [Linum grandiflorum]
MTPRKGGRQRKLLMLPSSSQVPPSLEPIEVLSDDEFQPSFSATRRRTRSVSRRLESVVMKRKAAEASGPFSKTPRASGHDMQNRNRKPEGPKVSTAQPRRAYDEGEKVKNRGGKDANESGDGEAGVEKDKENELVVRSRCSPKRIKELVSFETTSVLKIGLLDTMGFGGILQVQIGSLSELFNRWAVEAYDVGTQSFFFVDGDALTVTEEDVARVYAIPRGRLSINDATSHYTVDVMQGAAKVHHLDVRNQETVPLNTLKDWLQVEEDVNVWKNLAVLYLLGVLLRPRSHPDADLRVLPLLGSRSSEAVKEYNWCQYVVSHFHRGMGAAVNNMKAGTLHPVVNADMHLLMVCFCEKYGSRVEEERPLCALWDKIAFGRVLKEVKQRLGSTFMKVSRPKLRLPRPFTGLLRNVRDRLDGCPINELEAMLKWSKWAKYVIDSEITALEMWIANRKGEAPGHPGETGTAQNSVGGVANERNDDILENEQSPATPVGGGFSNTNLGISPPNFSLGVTQVDGMVEPGLVGQPVHETVHGVIEPDAGRPKRTLKKSKHTRTPYCVIVAPKRKNVGKREKPAPKPPRANFNSKKNLLIEYATNHDDQSLLGTEIIHRRDDESLSLTRREFRSLHFDQELVTDIVDAYTDFLNLREMEAATDGAGAKRWIFRTTLAQGIHCNVGNPEMEDSEYLSKIIEEVGLVDPNAPEVTLSDCEFLFFPICDGGHYSLFVVNRRDKRYEFLDSMYPDSFASKWRDTAERVVKYAEAYYKLMNFGESLDEYEWFVIAGVQQERESKECGIYMLNWAEAWEGTVEEFMTSTWQDKDYCRNRRKAICLTLITWEINIMYDRVLEEAQRWSARRWLPA